MDICKTSLQKRINTAKEEGISIPGKIIKAALVDIDGTLVNDEKKCTKRTKKAIGNFIKAGGDFSVMTGRGPLGGEEAIEKTGVEDGVKKGSVIRFMVCFNGAVVYDRKKDESVVKETVPKEQIESIIDAAHETGSGVYVVGYDKIYAESPVPTEAKVEAGRNHQQIEEVDDLNDLSEDVEIMKAVLSNDEHPERTAAAECVLLERDPYGIQDKGEIDPFVRALGRIDPDGGKNIEFVSPKAGKVNGLVKFSEITGNQIENMAYAGDGGNDSQPVAYLAGAGGLGIAMLNAVPETKEGANYITPVDNNHSGLAYPFEEVTKNLNKQRSVHKSVIKEPLKNRVAESKKNYAVIPTHKQGQIKSDEAR